MFLIQLGILLLLRNLGILNDNFWEELLVYFPVALIAVGVEKIFTKSRLQFIAYLTSVALFFGGFVIAFSSSLSGIEENFFSQTTYQENFEPSVKKIKAVIKLDGTDLTIRDSGSDLIYGRFDKFTRKPEIKYTTNDDIANIDLTSKPRNYLGGIIKFDMGKSQDWYLRFSDKAPLDLECYGKESNMHLNMSTSPLEKLKLDVNDANIYLKLGKIEPNVKVNIYGEDSKLKLRVPKDIGLKIYGTNYRSYLLRIGMEETSDNAFVNKGFDTLKTKVEVNLHNQLESFSIDYF